MSDDDFRTKADESLKKVDGEKHEAKRQEFVKQFQYFSGDYNDPQAFHRLAQRLEEIDREGQLGGNRLFFILRRPRMCIRTRHQKPRRRRVRR